MVGSCVKVGMEKMEVRMRVKAESGREARALKGGMMVTVSTRVTVSMRVRGAWEPEQGRDVKVSRLYEGAER